jgi:hypothetical protein
VAPITSATAGSLRIGTSCRSPSAEVTSAAAMTSSRAMARAARTCAARTFTTATAMPRRVRPCQSTNRAADPMRAPGSGTAVTSSPSGTLVSSDAIVAVAPGPSRSSDARTIASRTAIGGAATVCGSAVRAIPSIETMRTSQGLAIDIPMPAQPRPWLAGSISLARSARLGPLCGLATSTRFAFGAA